MRAMSSATTAACSPSSGATPPDHARAPAEWHHRDRALRAYPSSAPSCRAACRQNRVGCLRRFARAQAYEVGIALAGGMPDALGVIVAQASPPSSGATPRGRSRVAARRATARAQCHRWARSGRDTHCPSSSRSILRAPPPVPGSDRPTPTISSPGRQPDPPHRGGLPAGLGASAPAAGRGRLQEAGSTPEDPLQPVERFVDRLRRRPAHAAAAEVAKIPRSS